MTINYPCAWNLAKEQPRSRREPALPRVAKSNHCQVVKLGRGHLTYLINRTAHWNAVCIKMCQSWPGSIKLFLRKLVRIQTHNSPQARKSSTSRHDKALQFGFLHLQLDNEHTLRCPEGTYTAPLRILPCSYMQVKLKCNMVLCSLI